MTTRVFSDTIELRRMLINLGDGYAGESVNAAPVLPGHFEVTFQLDGEGAAALDHLLAAAALKMRPGMPPVRSIAQVFEHLKACGYEVTPDEWAPPGYIDLGWMAGGRCRVRNTHIRISGPWGRAYVEGEAATAAAGAGPRPTEPVRPAYRFARAAPGMSAVAPPGAGLTLRTWA